jgi:carbon-monoxide dehydrogenase small subunit
MSAPNVTKPARGKKRRLQQAAQRPPRAAERTIHVAINGRRYEFEPGRDLTPTMTLAHLLRDKLGFTGLKVACDEGACGGCTVLMDGKAVLSCMVLAVETHGHEILTVEGLPKDDPVIAAFAQQSEPGYGTALQCGYCTPGFVMASRALLSENPKPTLAEVKEALSGNICRCGCYAGIAQAVLHASEKTAATSRASDLRTARPGGRPSRRRQNKAAPQGERIFPRSIRTVPLTLRRRRLSRRRLEACPERRRRVCGVGRPLLNSMALGLGGSR